MSARKSLKINARAYTTVLRRNFKHSYYGDTQRTLRKQHENFLESDPTFDEFNLQTDTFSISLPYPVCQPDSVESEVDFCADLLEKKAKYKTDLKLFGKYFKKDTNWLTKAYVGKTKYTKLPKYVIDLCVGNIKDPDEVFEGNYNWYYTGGVLSSFTINDNEYVLCPLSNNNIRIVNVNDYEDTSIIEYRSGTDDFDRTPIYNARIDSANDKFVLTTRHRNSVNAFELLIDEEITLHPIFNHSSDRPFIDVKYRDEEVAYVNVDQNLIIKKIDMKHKVEYQFPKSDQILADPLCQIEFFDANNLGYIDRKTLRYLDVRSLDEKVFPIYDDYFICDDLCTLLKSEDSPYIFLASIHNIIKFDTRHNKVVKTWAHMLNSAPLVMKSMQCNYGNMFFVSSQLYNEHVILCSNEIESNLVQLVPNNMDTLNKCQISHEFDLFSEMYENRLKFSTVGIALTHNNNGVSLHSCNTLGDIFRNDVSRSRVQVEKTMTEFSKWKRNFKRKPKPLLTSNVRNMSHIKLVMYKPIKENNLKMYVEPNMKRTEFIAENTIEDVPMAHIWRRDTNGQEESLVSAIDSESKVTTWLQTVNYDDDSTRDNVSTITGF